MRNMGEQQHPQSECEQGKPAVDDTEHPVVQTRVVGRLHVTTSHGLDDQAERQPQQNWSQQSGRPCTQNEQQPRRHPLSPRAGQRHHEAGRQQHQHDRDAVADQEPGVVHLNGAPAVRHPDGRSAQPRQLQHQVGPNGNQCCGKRHVVERSTSGRRCQTLQVAARPRSSHATLTMPTSAL